MKNTNNNLEIKIKCEYNKLVPIHELVENPKNANKHSKEQIERLAKLISFQGFRHPIIVSSKSGFVVAGHGRLHAALFLKMTEVPVDYQDFESEAEEYAFLISDNEIARWAELDNEKLLEDLKEIDLGDIDYLGLEKIPSIKGIDDFNEKDIQFDFKLEIDCLNEEKQTDLKQELEERGFKVRLLL